ncbi:MAG: hypothetical protein K2K67_02575 [Treponemataceae bacterium]|nr:hypothetical protein [Treponemataceae bacterium]MDE7140739.1 hypothetical protein [Treponemataceae bacterium]
MQAVAKDYIELFVSPLYECLNYNPKFGNVSKLNGHSLADFLKLYGSDPFYSWIGLDSPYMFAAHKAAGAMTSVYRQIGIGCERLFRQILFDTAEYEDYSSAQWSYITRTQAGKEKILTLDARLELSDINNEGVKARVARWISENCRQLGIDDAGFKGAVFEVRQGYKSKDSKRQNADIDNATVAYAHHYLPVFSVFSAQIDSDIVLRYKNSRCCILVGNMDKSPCVSLFAFCKEILGFDLADFFKTNSAYIRGKVGDILEQLFRIDDAKN